MMVNARKVTSVELTIAGFLLAFGGMEFNFGGLDMIVGKDSQLGLHIMTKMYFAHISYLSGNGDFLMALIGILQEMILA